MPWPSSASCGASSCTWIWLRPWRLALELLKDKISRTPEETALEVLDFFQTRLQHLLLAEGFDHETITAVLAAGCRDVVDAADKVQALARGPPEPGISRPWPWPLKGSSISPRGPKPGEVTALLFEHPEENLLFEATGLMELEVTAALEKPGLSRGLPGPGQPAEVRWTPFLKR